MRTMKKQDYRKTPKPALLAIREFKVNKKEIACPAFDRVREPINRIQKNCFRQVTKLGFSDCLERKTYTPGRLGCWTTNHILVLTAAITLSPCLKCSAGWAVTLSFGPTYSDK